MRVFEPAVHVAERLLVGDQVHVHLARVIHEVLPLNDGNGAGVAPNLLMARVGEDMF